MLVLGQPHKKCPSRRRGRGRGSRRRRRRKLKAKCKAKAAVRGITGDKDKVNYSAPYTQPNASSPQYTPHTPLTPVPMYAVIFGQNSRWDQTKRRDAPPLPPPPLTSLGWL